MSATILVIEDEPTLGKNICRYLERQGYAAELTTSGEAGLARYPALGPDVLIVDFSLPAMNGVEVLRTVRAVDSRAKVIVITGQGSERVAVDAMKAGAYDYLSKPLALEGLRQIVDKALAERRLDDAAARGRDAAEGGAAALVGGSPQMVNLRSLILRVVEADRQVTDGELPAVLITGPTGTGKELIARAVHADGPRRVVPFVAITGMETPSHLLEAELFGYERGAFTDAKDRKPGLIETADDGTLFLDEIGDLDLALQAKLLKVLEDRRVRRLGSVRDQQTRARFIAAANRDLERLVQEGRFRADLFFRLRIVSIEAPPLSARTGDVRLLAGYFLALLSRRYGKPRLAFSPAAMAVLESHPWPGNVRELRNVIEQAVVLARGDVVDADAFTTLGPRAEETADRRAAAVPAPGMSLDQVEREMLTQALAQTSGNITRAARLLGITRDTLRYRMEKFNLRPGTGEAV